MANALFSNAKEEFLAGDLDLEADDIKLVLYDTDDGSVSTGSDQFLDDIASAGIEATSSNLSGKSITDGVFDADDVTLSNVSGDECEAIIIYQDSGSDSSSTLLVYIDNATGLPVQPNDGDISIVFDSSGVFSL